MKHIDIFTDGACAGNPGVGGWSAILRYKSFEKEISGGCLSTTNNRMELTAVIEALKILKEKCEVTVVTDSQYVVNAVNNKWLFSWADNGWKNAKNKQVPNRDLWEKLIKLMNSHSTTFVWVKGHNGHPENERCDVLAVNECENIKNKYHL